MSTARPFGRSGVEVACVGFGAMGITSFYAGTSATEEEGIKAIEAYVAAAAPALAHVDTALIYSNARAGGRHNEEVVGEALRRVGRDKVFLATKGSMSEAFVPDSSDAGLRAQLASSLKRLGVDRVDLYYEHRRDVKTPVEQVAATFKALAAEGKIRFAGLSECTADELRRACAVFPITAVQMEMSLQARSVETTGLLAAARELGVAVVAYSPLGRGMLSGTFASRAEVPEGDWRASNPRWSAELAPANFAKAAALKAVADRKGCSTAQLALAWLLSKGAFPIPGTTKAARALENLRAADVKLTPEEVAELEALVPEAAGDRYEGGWGQFEKRM
jgi:aryl-alcohol dehydrogenase-like predicted oxidoreductase